MRNVSDKIVEKIKRRTLFLNRADYEIMWKNIVQPGRPQMTICRMSIACSITKATPTLTNTLQTKVVEKVKTQILSSINISKIMLFKR